MTNPDELWRAYVERADVEVPAEAVEREVDYFTMQLRHNLRYDTLTGGDPHIFMAREVEEQRENIRAAALFEAKSGLVMKELLKRHDFPVTREELEAEAKAMAAKENTTLDMLQRFFGEDYSGLERDIRERKAREWACAQSQP